MASEATGVYSERMIPRSTHPDPWRLLWAKAPTPMDQKPRRWSPLHTHLTDTAEVVRLLWDDWVGDRLQAVIARDTGGDRGQAREIAALAGLLHDLGKATCAFAGQVPEMRAEIEHRTPLRWDAGFSLQDSRSLPHGLAGHLLVEDYLKQQNVPLSHARAFAVIVGGHHGVPPTEGELTQAATRHSSFGDELWDQARSALVEEILGRTGLHGAVEALRTVRLSDASQLLLTGLVIMADWIASSADYFPLVLAWQDNDSDPVQRALAGWRDLDLPRPWIPTDQALTTDVTELLRSRFDVTFEANSVQRAAVESARAMTEPGLMLVEAVMGVGKTEASLLAAEVLAAKFGCVGVFYGLPTRATADGIFPRLLPWWEGLPGRDPGDRNVMLRHGTASLNETFRGLSRHRRGDEGPLSDLDPVEVGRDVGGLPIWEGRGSISGRAIAHHWTSGRKKAAFADTVVATIDHELLAALTARHVVLRHLGLVRQVVILDEIHSADTWMFTYLARALEWLGRYGVPVIAMSATLEPLRRQQLVDAYERGRRTGLVQSSEGPLMRGGLIQPRVRTKAPVPPEVPITDAYPLVTSLSAGVVSQICPDPGSGRSVEVAWLADGPDELEQQIETVVDAGGCVLVIRNTVRRAVATYRQLRAGWGEAVTLAHSRFIAHDRLRRDDWLRATFGKDGDDREGRIVVATQVAEQSLDVDFDLLITDLAPIDLLLQRIGRLHRHPGRSRPAQVSTARVLVAGLTDLPSAQAAPGVDPGAAKVYGAHHLLRTAALLDEVIGKGQSLHLPEDVPTLVRRCYGEEPLGPPAWQVAMVQARSDWEDGCGKDEHNSRAYLLRSPGAETTAVGLLAVQVGEAETSPGMTRAVRKDDGGFDVIVLQQAADGWRLLPHLGDDRLVPTDIEPDRDTVALIARSIVRVPGWVTDSPSVTDAVLDDLCRTFVRAWQHNPVLGGQLILLLDEEMSATMGPFHVSYDVEVGLEVDRV